MAGDAVCCDRRARIQNWIIALGLSTDRQAAAIIQFWEDRSRPQHAAEPAGAQNTEGRELSLPPFCQNQHTYN